MEGRSRTVEQIFDDFKSRRTGIIKALTVGIISCSIFFKILAKGFFISLLDLQILDF